MNKMIILPSSIIVILAMSVVPSTITFAEQNTGTTEIIPLGGSIGLEKTTISMSIPEGNSLPWGYVEGKIANHVAGYPVIIQIYDEENPLTTGNIVGAVRFAQTDVSPDGTYEYQFRVFSVDGDTTTYFFDGDYTVKIFKVVYLNSNLSSI